MRVLVYDYCLDSVGAHTIHDFDLGDCEYIMNTTMYAVDESNVEPSCNTRMTTSTGFKSHHHQCPASVDTGRRRLVSSVYTPRHQMHTFIVVFFVLVLFCASSIYMRAVSGGE